MLIDIAIPRKRSTPGWAGGDRRMPILPPNLTQSDREVSIHNHPYLFVHKTATLAGSPADMRRESAGRRLAGRDIRLGGDPDIQADLCRPDLPLTAVPTHDDPRGFQAVERLFDVGRHAVFVFGDQVELSPDQAQNPTDRGRAFLGDVASGLRGTQGRALERQLRTSESIARTGPNQLSPNPKYSPWWDAS